MEFGPVPIHQAQGAILAHSVRLNGARLRKGIVLTEDHIAQLDASGLNEVVVARLGPADMHENAAAEQIAVAVSGSGVRLSAAATGRVNIYATGRGIAALDAARIDRLNAIDPMITVATVPEWRRMEAGGMLATVKIIAYGVPDDAVAAACDAGADSIALKGPVIENVSLIETTIASEAPGKGRAAIAGRLRALGIDLETEPYVVSHEVDALAAALKSVTGQAVFVLTASATSDLQDVAPAAVRRAGGTVAHFGMPVDPGNLLFLGELDGKPVIGLPGCARSPALNGADWVMDRVLCGVAVTSADIQRMGVGGLLKEIPIRGRLREPE